MLIGELARRSGVSARMLRHYDRIGLVSPSERTAGGYRRYTQEDLRRLFQVEALRSLGLTLQEVADALDDPSFAPSSVIDDLIVRTRERIEGERQLLHRLEQVHGSGADAWPDVLGIIGLLNGLESDSPSARQSAALSDAARGTNAALIVDAALDEDDANAAGAFDWALARIGDAAVPLLSAALQADTPERRRRAAATLEKIGSVRALDALTSAATSADPAVRARATLARGRRGETEAVPGLLDLVVEGRADVDAADVLETLARDPAAAAMIMALIDERLDTADAAARARLAGALAGIPGPHADAILTTLSTDPDERVALTARYLLGVRGR